MWGEGGRPGDRATGRLGAAAVLLLLASRLAAQGVIVGRVVDAANAEPRAGAAVSVVGTARGAIADSSGRYLIAEVAPGTVTVRVRLFGYKQIERGVTVSERDTTRVDFALETEAAVLGAV